MENFFQESGRGETYRSLILDILAEKPLLKLIGKEGAGKTVICRLIEERLPETYWVVALKSPGGAFEDLLGILCERLGKSRQGASRQVDELSECKRLLAQVHDQGKRVVLVIDEAEKLLLTSLERLLRHVGEGNGDLKLTLVLAGRPGLDENLRQVASLGTGASFSGAYTLSDLSESETRQYLRFRGESAGVARDHFAKVFTEEVVSKIYTAARGNLNLVNILAEEALQNFCAEKSFMALLDQVEPGTGAEDEPRPSRTLLLYDLLRSHPIFTVALSGAIILVLGIGLFLNFTATSPPRDEPRLSRTSPQSTTNSQIMPQHGQPDPQAVLQERIGASDDWLAGLNQGRYTIQLMRLSSPMAQSRLAETLAMDEYASILNQIYILHSQTTPPTLFVYYGIYDSLDVAREARNNMPVFLRKHQPYPLSISEAKGKIDTQ